MNTERNRNERRGNYVRMRFVKDITMSIIILSMSFIMFFGNKIPALQPIMQDKDQTLGYAFGALCLLYGGFRLYRALTMKDY